MTRRRWHVDIPEGRDAENVQFDRRKQRRGECFSSRRLIFRGKPVPRAATAIAKNYLNKGISFNDARTRGARPKRFRDSVCTPDEFVNRSVRPRRFPSFRI